LGTPQDSRRVGLRRVFRLLGIGSAQRLAPGGAHERTSCLLSLQGRLVRFELRLASRALVVNRGHRARRERRGAEESLAAGCFAGLLVDIDRVDAGGRASPAPLHASDPIPIVRHQLVDERGREHRARVRLSQQLLDEAPGLHQRRMRLLRGEVEARVKGCLDIGVQAARGQIAGSDDEPCSLGSPGEAQLRVERAGSLAMEDERLGEELDGQ
jgi:hypothetical protein